MLHGMILHGHNQTKISGVNQALNSTKSSNNTTYKQTTPDLLSASLVGQILQVYHLQQRLQDCLSVKQLFLPGTINKDGKSIVVL